MSTKLDIPDRYDLTRMGPMGGQASVFYARDKWLDRDVVMKAGLPGASYDVAAEVRSLAAVNSKHVVALYDTIQDAKGVIAAIVEESVDGQSLRERLTAGLPVAEKLRLLYQIACGVTDIHSVGRIHRDLKPNNMKVRPDGLLKIFDLGISTNLADGDETQIGKGSRGYKAPELFGSPPMKVSTKCDSYSIGVIAHQLLSDGRLAHGFLKEPPDPQTDGINFELLTGTGTELTTVLDASLASDSRLRPEAAEIRDSLASEIVRDMHRAVIVSAGQPFVLDSTNRTVRVGNSGNDITVEYDGTAFVIRALTGDVYVNNRTMRIGDKLNGAMVITLGAPAIGAARRFVTFDISHPEILV
ncbi:MAG: protein kinase [Opitutaceae bacterium]